MDIRCNRKTWTLILTLIIDKEVKHVESLEIDKDSGQIIIYSNISQ